MRLKGLTEPRLARSGLLTVLLRLEVTPGDARFDAYVEYVIESVEPACSCVALELETMCDACWLQEAAQAVGIRELLIPLLAVPDVSHSLSVRGCMQSERIGSLEGDDYIESFVPVTIRVVPLPHDDPA
jgi:hypothetical protein